MTQATTFTDIDNRQAHVDRLMQRQNRLAIHRPANAFEKPLGVREEPQFAGRFCLRPLPSTRTRVVRRGRRKSVVKAIIGQHAGQGGQKSAVESRLDPKN